MAKDAEGIPLGGAIRLFEQLLAGELEDLEKPPEQRRSKDLYDGPGEVLSHQFLVDACRAHYCISGVDYCFAEADEPGSSFSERLATAVLRCLSLEGGIPSVLLGRFATMLLSQAGLALSDAALPGPRLALSGGSRNISYGLRRSGPGAWEITAEFSAHGFTQYLEAGSCDSVPEPCSPDSALRKGFELQVLLGEVVPEVQVLAMVNSLSLLDIDGRPIDLQEPLPPETEEHGGGSWWDYLTTWPSFWSTGADVPGPADEQEKEEPADDDTAAADLNASCAAAPLQEGLESRELSAWESEVLVLPAQPEEDILKAWYGHPSDKARRIDVTDDIRERVAEKMADEGEGAELAISASNAEWGDPCRFVWKQLSVTVRRRESEDSTEPCDATLPGRESDDSERDEEWVFVEKSLP